MNLHNIKDFSLAKTFSFIIFSAVCLNACSNTSTQTDSNMGNPKGNTSEESAQAHIDQNQYELANAAVEEEEISTWKPVTATIFFAFDSAKLSPAAIATLKKLHNINVKSATRYEVSVTGHTDSSGSIEYNKELSLKRAQAIQQYVKNNTILSKALWNVAGKGETMPQFSNASEWGRERNRRAQIVINTENFTAASSVSSR